MIRSAGFTGPMRLRAAVHPILQNQYAALTQALFRLWAEVGVEVESPRRRWRPTSRPGMLARASTC